MKILYVVNLFLSTFAFIKNKCPMRILPEFCNDKTDSRCTSDYHYGPSGQSLGEKYPSEPRDIKLDVTYTEDYYQILNLTWKPPNDSSISYLLGYEMGLVGMTWETYLYNLTEAHLTPNDSEIVFSFACKLERRRQLAICFHSLPIPKDNSFHCKEANPQRPEEPESVTMIYTPAIPVHPVVYKSSNHRESWYIYLGVGIFVLTFIIFSLFLLKDFLFRERSDIFEIEMDRINQKNSNYLDAEFSEEEYGEV